MNDLDDVTFDGDGRTDRASLHGNVSLYYNGPLSPNTSRASLQGFVTIVRPLHIITRIEVGVTAG
ncbi:MAG: hypothetical protein PUI89_04725 [Bacteroidales bacterium]|nr:hypothetical protein [Bacteroidales bacterium]